MSDYTNGVVVSETRTVSAGEDVTIYYKSHDDLEAAIKQFGKHCRNTQDNGHLSKPNCFNINLFGVDSDAAEIINQKFQHHRLNHEAYTSIIQEALRM